MKAPTDLASFIGIPYENRGSGFGGCDCWGLVWLYYSEVLGIPIPRYSGYLDAEAPAMVDYVESRWNQWQQVPRSEMRPGDVLALKVGKLAVHCGVYVGEGKMLHVMEGRMSCLERVDRGFWHNAIVRVGRWTS